MCAFCDNKKNNVKRNISKPKIWGFNPNLQIEVREEKEKGYTKIKKYIKRKCIVKPSILLGPSGTFKMNIISHFIFDSNLNSRN